jgi:hypothetical protein
MAEAVAQAPRRVATPAVAPGLTEDEKTFIRKKLAEPKIFVNGRRRFKDEVRASPHTLRGLH